MALKIFISYSTKDIHIVNQVQNLLQNTPIEIFVAEYSVRPSEVLSSSIEEAILNCDLFLLLWSHNSKESEWVPQEIGIAKAAEKKINLPVSIKQDWYY